MDCLFCKFANKELIPEIVFENDDVLGFKDISPCAKVHVLFIPKVHSQDIADLVTQGFDLNIIFKAMTDYAKQEGLDKDGYRIVNNLGTFGGQTIFHTHFHLIAGEQLRGFGA